MALACSFLSAGALSGCYYTRMGAHFMFDGRMTYDDRRVGQWLCAPEGTLRAQYSKGSHFWLAPSHTGDVFDWRLRVNLRPAEAGLVRNVPSDQAQAIFEEGPDVDHLKPGGCRGHVTIKRLGPLDVEIELDLAIEGPGLSVDRLKGTFLFDRYSIKEEQDRALSDANLALGAAPDNYELLYQRARIYQALIRDQLSTELQELEVEDLKRSLSLAPAEWPDRRHAESRLEEIQARRRR